MWPLLEVCLGVFCPAFSRTAMGVLSFSFGSNVTEMAKLGLDGKRMGGKGVDFALLGVQVLDFA
jgi:hypothetical protein